MRDLRARGTSSSTFVLRLCVSATAVVALCMLFTSHSSTNFLLPPGSLPSPSNFIHHRTLTDIAGINIPGIGDDPPAEDAATEETPVEEAPVEETPAEEPPVVEPVEEVPEVEPVEEVPEVEPVEEVPEVAAEPPAEDPAEEPTILPPPPPFPPPPFPPPTNFSVPAPPAPTFTPGESQFGQKDPSMRPPPPLLFEPPPPVEAAPTGDESASEEDDSNTRTIAYGAGGAAGALVLLLLAFCACKYCRKEAAPATAEIDRQFNQLAGATTQVVSQGARTAGSGAGDNGRFVPSGGPPAGL